MSQIGKPIRTIEVNPASLPIPAVPDLPEPQREEEEVVAPPRREREPVPA